MLVIEHESYIYAQQFSILTFIFSFSADSNSAIFAIESTRTRDPNT